MERPGIQYLVADKKSHLISKGSIKNMIITKTPLRISFFGGGTDYPVWYEKNGGSVLSTTINKYSYINARYLPQFFDHKHQIIYKVREEVKDTSQIKYP